MIPAAVWSRIGVRVSVQLFVYPWLGERSGIPCRQLFPELFGIGVYLHMPHLLHSGDTSVRETACSSWPPYTLVSVDVPLWSHTGITLASQSINPEGALPAAPYTQASVHV